MLLLLFFTNSIKVPDFNSKPIKVWFGTRPFQIADVKLVKKSEVE